MGAINSDTLRKRYLDELRPNFVGRVERIDTTLEIWVEMIDEIAKDSG